MAASTKVRPALPTSFKLASASDAQSPHHNTRHATNNTRAIQSNLNQWKRAGRGDGGRTNGFKTHCPKGHAYAGDNVQFYQYGKYIFRRCKACYKARYEASKTRLH